MKPIDLAGCIIIDDYDRILLLHRNTDDYQHWELPGGKLEPDETAEAAAVREVKEELGVAVHLTKALGSGTFADNDRSFRFHWFTANIIDGEPRVMETKLFDDTDYFELEDLMSVSLSANMTLLLEKISAGEIAISG